MKKHQEQANKKDVHPYTRSNHNVLKSNNKPRCNNTRNNKRALPENKPQPPNYCLTSPKKLANQINSQQSKQQALNATTKTTAQTTARLQQKLNNIRTKEMIEVTAVATGATANKKGKNTLMPDQRKPSMGASYHYGAPHSTHAKPIFFKK